MIFKQVSSREPAFYLAARARLPRAEFAHTNNVAQFLFQNFVHFAYCNYPEIVLYLMYQKKREVSRMNELKNKDMIWVVINADGTYVGVPCLSFEEARELAVNGEGRRIFNLDPNEEDVTESENGLI